MSGEVKRDMKEDNPTDDALTNTYNALKVTMATSRLFDLSEAKNACKYIQLGCLR